MKPYLIGGFILTGLLLLAWPYGIFGTIFIFEAPIRSTLDAGARYSLAGSIVAYPVVWCIALVVAIRAHAGKQARRCATAIVAPILWLGLPVVFMGLVSPRPPIAWETPINDRTTFQEIVRFTKDPDYRIRASAYRALGQRADGLREPEKRQALYLLIGGLGDHMQAVEWDAAVGLKALGSYAEPAIATVLNLAPHNPQLIQILPAIGKSRPEVVIPALLRMVRAANSNGWRSMSTATMAVKALGSFSDQAAEIVPEIRDFSTFRAHGFLGVWITTMTTLDPAGAYYDQAILEDGVVAVLADPHTSYATQFRVLTALSTVKALTPNERASVAAVARQGGTPQLRARAKRILVGRDVMRWPRRPGQSRFFAG